MFSKITLENRWLGPRWPARIWPLWLLLCLVQFAVLKCEAATIIWDGGGTNAFWDTVLNWSTDTLPADGDTLQFSSGLGSGAAINLNGNRTAQKLIISTLSSFSITNSTLTINSGDITRSDIAGTEADHTITSAITLGADGAWIIDGSGSLILSGVISGAKKGTKSGAGTLVLSGANTFSGEMSVTAGTLALGNDSAVGTGNFKVGAATIQSYGAARTIGNTLTLDQDFTIGGSLDLTFSGDASLARDIIITADNTGSSTFSGAISGGHTLTKEGTGILILSGANGHDETYVNAGVLNIRHGSALGGAKKSVVASGAALEIQGGITVSSEPIDLSGSGISNGGAMRNVSGNNSWGGNLTLKSASAVASDSGTLSISGDIINGGFAATMGGAGDITASGIISGTGALTKEGAGTVTLSGTSANTFSGAVTVNGGTLLLNKTAALNAYAGTLTVGDGTGGASADVVRLGADNQMPSTTVTINSSGLLDLNGYSDTIGALTMTGGSVTTGVGTLTLGGNVTGNADASTATISGNLALGANRTFTLADGAASTDMSVSAIVSGAFTLTKAGAGTLVLSGANTYSGATTISNGVVNIQNSTGFGTTAGGVTVISGAEAQLQGGISVGAEALTLNGSGISSGGALRNISGNNSWSGAATLGSASTIASDSGTLTLSGNLTNGGFTSTFSGAGDVAAGGVISGTGGLTKSGAGTLTVSGNNTFTGALNVSAGTLLLGAADRIADTVNVTLSGGKLSSGGFNETVGTLTLMADSVIDFGSGASVIHFASSAAASWTGGTVLTITNWSGPYAGGGTDQLFFGTGITGLTGSQLGQIQFVDNLGNRQLANILANGEVVPIPEPATVISVMLVAAGLVYRERKSLGRWVGDQVGRRKLALARSQRDRRTRPNAPRPS